MAARTTWPETWDDGLRKAVFAARTITNFARGLGVARRDVYRWKQIPGDLVVKAEVISGIPREELRPDLFVRDKVTQGTGVQG